MKENDIQTEPMPEDETSGTPNLTRDAPDRGEELAALTDKWKRALAEAENARKRADAARIEGREHAPAIDAVFLAIETAHNLPKAKNPWVTAHLEGLATVKTAFETGLKALGVRMIAPKDTAFDPQLHEAMQIQETDATKPGNVLILHRPGFAIGQRLIRPAHVTVSAASTKTDQE